MSDGTAAPPLIRRIVFFKSLGKAPARLGSGVEDACRRALTTIVATGPGEWRMVVDVADPHREFGRQLARDAGLTTQLADTAGAE